MVAIPPKTVILIPVYNEASNVGPLCGEIMDCFPEAEVCFIDDGSTDGTLRLLQRLPCRYLALPCNLGVGGAMQAGFRYAFENGYEYAIRLDGDGQHPPGECEKLVERMSAGDVDMVVGSRFLGDRSYTSSWYRQIGIFGLAAMLSTACRRRITDPTSGFQMVNRAAMYFLSLQYPADYPEPEALALLSRQGYRCTEVAVRFRARHRGQSSIQTWGTLYYLFKVSVALFVDRCRAVDSKCNRQTVEALL